ncbi:MAG: AtpZ/AtpI family protein [Candidatus Gastranaerophilaceae bacterium]|jgi:F0F1-type ATP synthase assembly protein I
MDIVFNLIGPIIFGFFVGQYFDRYNADNFPLWTIIGITLGFITGMWAIYKKYIM